MGNTSSVSPSKSPFKSPSQSKSLQQQQKQQSLQRRSRKATTMLSPLSKTITAITNDEADICGTKSINNGTNKTDNQKNHEKDGNTNDVKEEEHAGCRSSSRASAQRQQLQPTQPMPHPSTAPSPLYVELLSSSSSSSSSIESGTANTTPNSIIEIPSSSSSQSSSTTRHSAVFQPSITTKTSITGSKVQPTTAKATAAKSIVTQKTTTTTNRIIIDLASTSSHSTSSSEQLLDTNDDDLPMILENNPPLIKMEDEQEAKEVNARMSKSAVKLTTTTVKKENGDTKCLMTAIKNTTQHYLPDVVSSDTKTAATSTRTLPSSQPFPSSSMLSTTTAEDTSGKGHRCIVYIEKVNDFFGRCYTSCPTTTTTALSSTTITKRKNTTSNNIRTDNYQLNHWMMGYMTYNKDSDDDDDVSYTVQLDNKNTLYNVPQHHIHLLVPLDDVPILQQAQVKDLILDDDHDNDAVLYPLDINTGTLITQLLVPGTSMDSSNSSKQIGCVTTANQQQLWYCNTHPKQLYIGDVVQVYYQNGNEFFLVSDATSTTKTTNSSSEAVDDVVYHAWYRGRICDIRTMETKSNDNKQRQQQQKLVDIAYDDGDIEYNVPFCGCGSTDSCSNQIHNKVVLLQRGYHDISWLQNLYFLKPSDSSTSKTAKGKINISDCKASLLHQIDPTVFNDVKSYRRMNINEVSFPVIPVTEKGTSNGKHQTAMLSYAAIVSEIYNYELYGNPSRKKKHVAYVWPTSSEDTTKANTKRTGRNTTKQETLNIISTAPASTKIEQPSNTLRSARSCTLKRKMKYVYDDDECADNENDKVEYTPSKRKNVGGTRATAKTVVHDSSACSTAAIATGTNVITERRNRKKKNKKDVCSDDDDYDYESSDELSAPTETFKETKPKRGGNTKRSTTKSLKAKSTSATTKKMIATKRKNEVSKECTISTPSPDKRIRTNDIMPPFSIDQDVKVVLENEWDWSISNIVVDAPSNLSGRHPTCRVTVMDNSIANPLGKALHSGDTDMVAELLTFLSQMHNNTIPNETLWKYILELNTFGPKLDNVCFPDVIKMKVTLEYIQHLFTIPSVLDRCCSYIDQQFSRLNGTGCGGGIKKNGSGYGNQVVHVTYVECFGIQMLSNYYMKPVDIDKNGSTSYSSDLKRHTILSYERIYATLHAKVCYAEVFIQLLQHQLQSVIIQDHINTTKKHANTTVSIPDYHSFPIVRDMLNIRRGVKEVLENMIKALVVVLVQFAIPFIYDDQILSHHNDSTSTGSQNNISILLIMKKIHYVIDRLTVLLGIGISYVGWLYGKEANESSYSIAEMIGRIYDQEMELLQSTTKCEVGKTKKSILHSHHQQDYETSIQFRIIDSMDKNIIPQLRPKLAERFHIAGMYNFLYADGVTNTTNNVR